MYFIYISINEAQAYRENLNQFLNLVKEHLFPIWLLDKSMPDLAQRRNKVITYYP